MLVEDDEDIGALISFALKQAGHKVSWAKDGVHALMLVKQESPDLVVTDFMFPAGGGGTFHQRLRMSARTLTTPIVIISAVPKEVIVTALGPVKNTYYVEKPYKKDELLGLIDTILSSGTDETRLLGAPPSEESAAATEAARRSAKGDVLVVDESKEVRASVRAALEKTGFAVAEAADAAEALSLLGLDTGSTSSTLLRPRLVVLDAQLPGDGSLTLNSRLMHYASTARIPVIVLTARRELPRLIADRTQLSEYPEKPIDPGRAPRYGEGLLPARK